MLIHSSYLNVSNTVQNGDLDLSKFLRLQTLTLTLIDTDKDVSSVIQILSPGNIPPRLHNLRLVYHPSPTTMIWQIYNASLSFTALQSLVQLLSAPRYLSITTTISIGRLKRNTSQLVATAIRSLVPEFQSRGRFKLDCQWGMVAFIIPMA